MKSWFLRGWSGGWPGLLQALPNSGCPILRGFLRRVGGQTDGSEIVPSLRRGRETKFCEARLGAKGQVIGAVAKIQAAHHEMGYGISGVAAHPCKKRKDGAPAFCCGTKTDRAEGWATRQKTQGWGTLRGSGAIAKMGHPPG